MRVAVANGRILSSVVRTVISGDTDELTAAVAGRDLSTIPQLAELHGIAPAAFLALSEVAGTDPLVIDRLRSGYHRGVRAHLLALGGLDLVYDVLEPITPWLAVKGPVLAEAVYRRPDLRSYVDLDVVVSPNHFPAAVAALELAGCRVLDRNWRRLASERPGELRLVLPSGLLVDLHWHVLHQPRLRDAFSIDPFVVARRSCEVEIGGRCVRTLDPALTLVHLALHASLAGGDKLVWVMDLHQAVTNLETDWDAVVEVAQRTGAALPTAAMLDRARRVVAFEVPDTVMRTLRRSRAWASLVDGVTRTQPVERASGRPSLSRIVVRSTRSDGWSSVRELGHRARRWVADGARLHHQPAELDPTSPRSILFETGGVAERVRYMSAVLHSET